MIGLGQFNALLDASVGNSLDATLILIALYMTELPSFVEFPFQILVTRSTARNFFRHYSMTSLMEMVVRLRRLSTIKVIFIKMRQTEVSF